MQDTATTSAIAARTTAQAAEGAKPQGAVTPALKVANGAIDAKDATNAVAAPAKAVSKPAKAKAKVGASKPAKALAKPSKAAKGQAKGKPAKVKAVKVLKAGYPRHAKNPFRVGSAYGSCFDILASFGRGGCTRKTLTELLAKERKSDLKHAYYDSQVLMTAKKSNGGARHASCRKGFWIKRDDDKVVLMID